MADNMNMDDREKLLRQDGILIGIAVVCLLNGMYFSPWINLFAAALAPLLASFFITSPVLLLYFASLTLSVVTAILAGIPAALYERSRGLTHSNGASLGIWLASALLLSIPAIMGLFN
jgi:hypothetical protein